MKYLFLKIFAACTLAYVTLFATSAVAQVTYDSVVNNAIKKNETQTDQHRNNQNSVDQLLNNFYSEPTSNQNTYRQNNPYNTSTTPNYRTQQRPSYYDTPAGSRFRATQEQQRSTGAVSANNPDAAWEAVKRSQSYGFKRKMTDLDDYTISEDDLLDATENGQINVNNIPDTTPQPLGELCCPDGTSYVFGICSRVTINRGSSEPQYSEYSPGSKPPGGVCQGFSPIPGARILN